MRIWDDQGFIPFELEVLTPVHIGSGEDFSPLEYVLRQPGENQYEVWLIDTAAWLAENQSDSRVGKALDAGDMAGLRTLLNGSANLASCLLAKIHVASVVLGKELLRKRNTVDNKAEIMAFARNPFTHMPYVPASSIKGAISTAITDYLNEKRKIRAQATLRESSNYQGIMREMFGNISEHAMQALRLADIALPPGATSIREALGVGLPHGKSLPKTPCETLKSGEGIRAYGNMRFALFNGCPAIALPDGSSITVPDIRKICNDFYRKRFTNEYEKFYTRPHFAETGKALVPVSERIRAMDEEREMLLRVGRYSHIECVTVSGDPPPMKKGFGKTRTLADNVLPFGWVILKQCSMAEYSRGLALVDQAMRKEIDDVTAIAQLLHQQQQAAAERVQKEKEAARKRELELAAMSPQERAIWELGQPGATENQAIALYGKLTDLGELQAKAAEALKRFWQACGKWEGKQLTKKQKEKVAAIRAILEA